MNLYFRFIFLTILIVLLNSCGHEKTEEDKYPDLPYFPETTETKIQFQKINFSPYGFYKIDDIYFSIAEEDGEHYPKDLYIFHYKSDLITKTDSIPLNGDLLLIDESGFLYSSNYETDPDKYDINHKINKIDVRTGEKKNIDYIQYNYKKEYQNIFKLNKEYEKQLAHLPDSLIKEIRFKRIDSVEKEIRKKFKTNILNGLQKVREIGLNSLDDSYLLQYANKEVVIKSLPYLNHNTGEEKNPIDILENYTKYIDLETIRLEKTADLDIFDYVVRSNHLGGGRFNFSLSQSGIQYYELNFKNEKALFKLKTRYLYKKDLLQTFIMPDKKTIVLYSNSEQFKLSL